MVNPGMTWASLVQDERLLPWQQLIVRPTPIAHMKSLTARISLPLLTFIYQDSVSEGYKIILNECMTGI